MVWLNLTAKGSERAVWINMALIESVWSGSGGSGGAEFYGTGEADSPTYKVVETPDEIMAMLREQEAKGE